MGGGVSSTMKEALTGEKEFWTDAEKLENEKSLERQKKASEFVLKYMMLDIPVRLVKKSVDPMAPLWIEVDPNIVKDVLEKDNKAIIDKTSLQSIPSGVLIDYNGGIKVYFTSINVVYDLNVEDIDNAIDFYETKTLNSFNTGNSSPNRLVISGPKPKAPILKCAHTHKLELEWILPQPCGIIQRLEVQYVRINYRSKKGLEKEEKIEDRHWLALVSQSWEYSHFLNYSFDNLKPGSAFKFRIRYRNIMGYSEYSEPSELICTLSDIPDPPAPPICSAITCDSAQLHWMYPKRDNGSKVNSFVLFGKAVGDEFVELFRGNRLSYLCLDLHPGFAYSFKVAAVNELGLSICSETKSIQTPNKPSQRSMTAFEEFVEQNDDVNNLYDAWSECWDPKSQKYFYFNRVSGTRQLKCPEVLLKTKIKVIVEDEDEESETKSEAIIAVEKDKLSRVQRYKFFHSLKKVNTDPVIHASSFPDLRESPISSNIDNNNEDNSSSTVRKDIFLLNLKRDTLLIDAYKKISKATLQELQKRIKVEFTDEEGIDSGGVAKEAFLLISRQTAQYCGPSFRGWMMFTPDKEKGTLLYFCDEGMFDKRDSKSDRSDKIVRNNDDSISFASVLELEKLNLNGPKFSYFCGRLLGKALFDRQHVDFPLCPLLLKLMVNGFADIENQFKKLSVRDSSVIVDDLFHHLNDLDFDYSKSLKWMLENNITNVLYENFSVEVGNQVIALCDGGIKKEVTENNKWEYVNLLIQWKALYSVSKCLAPFLQGFHELIPLQLLKENNISHEEIDLLLNGRKRINIEEIRAYTIYQGSKEFSEKHIVVIWLWQIFRELEDEEQCLLLQFFTGSERVPLDGYDPPLNITEGIDMSFDSLPRAHTCFHQLVIPSYTSYTIMKDKIRYAINNTEGFTLA